MIKRIPVNELVPKMFLTDLNFDGVVHGDIPKTGVLEDQLVIDDIQKLGVQYVYIDTAKGPDSKSSVSIHQLDRSLEKELATLTASEVEAPTLVDWNDEMVRAVPLYDEAQKVMTALIQEMKDKKQLTNLAVAEKIAKKIIDSTARNRDVLICLGTVRNKAKYIQQHSINLAVLMSVFTRFLSIKAEAIEQAVLGALLHDLGKVFIPKQISDKPGALTDSEFATMKKHVALTNAILEKTSGLSETALQVATQHCERVDGSGYPQGLAGKDISVFGRMIGILDVYDAITNDRSFRERLAPGEALKKLLQWSETTFDKQLVHGFIKCLGIYPTGSMVFMESNHLGVVIQQNPDHKLEPIVKCFFLLKPKGFISPKIIDLSKKINDDKILKAVDPRAFKIKVEDFILN